MASKPTWYRRLFDSQIPRSGHRSRWASIVASSIATLPFAARADNPDSAHNHATRLGHLTGSDMFYDPLTFLDLQRSNVFDDADVAILGIPIDWNFGDSIPIYLWMSYGGVFSEPGLGQ